MSAEDEDPPVPPERKWHILRWISLTVAVLVLGALVTAWYEYRTVDDAIHREPVTGLGPRPPVYSTGSMNILVFGSDSRRGLDHHEQVALHTGNDSSSNGAGNTDTIMLVHISPGRRQVTVMSIPRDIVVPRYACASGPGYPGQTAGPTPSAGPSDVPGTSGTFGTSGASGASAAASTAPEVRINSLLAAGGPSCLWKTVERQTGIRIDHFLQIGLAGFANVIDDLGGVNVCAPFPIDNPVSGLVLKAGEQHIGGAAALAFWRARENIGLGSDLQRIQRDQFMSAQVVKGLLHSGLLSNPSRLLAVANGLAPSLTTDTGMSLPDLVSLGESLRNLSDGNVRFLTVPTVPDPADPATVDLAQPRAGQMFAAIAWDYTGPAPQASATPSVSVAPPASFSQSAVSARRVRPPRLPVTPPPASPSPSPSGAGSTAVPSGGISAAASCRSDTPAFQGPLSPAPTRTPAAVTRGGR